MALKVKIFIYMILVLCVSSCGLYSFKGSIPAHIDSIYVSPIKNNSKEYIVLDVLNSEIYDTFLSENILKLTDVNGSKSRLDITIISVTDKPFTYFSGVTKSLKTFKLFSLIANKILLSSFKF